MATHQHLITVPAPVAMPRGATWAADAAHAIVKAWRGARQRATPLPYRRVTPTLLEVIGRSIWRALHGMGQRRAERELKRLEERWQSIEPAVARSLYEARRDIAAVRELADSYRKTDPGMASDLHAAADRHERGIDDANEGARV